MSLFKTEMLWLHPPRQPPRPPRGYRAFGTRAPRYGHARRSVADTPDPQTTDVRIDATPPAPLDRAA